MIAEQTDFGLLELDPTTSHVVVLEYWRGETHAAPELLKMLPAHR